MKNNNIYVKTTEMKDAVVNVKMTAVSLRMMACVGVVVMVGHGQHKHPPVENTVVKVTSVSVWTMVCVGVLVMARQSQHTCGKHYR